MARLVVEAIGTAGEAGSSGVARAGNSDPLYLTVSVTDQDGVPTGDLATLQFTVDVPIVAAGGAGVDVAQVYGGAGRYRIHLVPTTFQGTQYTWRPGSYVFFVAVVRGSDQGQTLCKTTVIQ
jgi:hypothetical protein